MQVKTALVTGSAGFLGRHITAAFKDAGYAVTGVDRPYDARAWLQLDSQSRPASERFDVVVHAAAKGAHRAAIDRTPLALAVNLELDAAMFAWAARTRPGRVVYLSSSAAYPAHLQGPGGGPLREDTIDPGHPAQPDGIYGWIKLTGERLAALTRDAGVPVTVVRPFSGYGEDQDPRFPFGAMLERARAREDPFVIWGTGGQVRDFVHVDDVCAAILTMIGEGIDGPVNLGTGRGIMLIQLAGMMCQAAGYRPEVQALPDKPSGVACRVAGVTRLHTFYRPKVSLEEGVARGLALTADRG